MKKDQLFVAVVLATSVASAIAAPPKTDALALCYQFEQYPVKDVFKGPFKTANVKQDSDTWRFRTRLKEGSEGPPDFAGHLNIVNWGCGTFCQIYMAVDRRTGKILRGFGAEFGIEYHIDSRLMVADGGQPLRDFFGNNPILPEGSSEAENYQTRYYLYDDEKGSISELPGCTDYEKNNKT